MKCYFLLRNNVEIGPFTHAEIKAQNLQSTDLVWIEGKSTKWKYPLELETLRPFVLQTAFTEQLAPGNRTWMPEPNSIFIALPSHLSTPAIILKALESKETAEMQTGFTKPLAYPDENSNGQKKQMPSPIAITFSKPHSALWLASVFASLLLSAAILKRIMERYNGRESDVTISAAMPAQDRNKPENSLVEEGYQNALTTELVMVDTATLKPIKKTPAKVNLRKMVRLVANDYRVGMFGGIKNLRLLITNKSAFVLDKVKIKLQYLKQNGDVLKTEYLTLNKVAPKSSKSLAVSPHNRGMKVSYHITEIQSELNTDYEVSL